jgi:hypothetical protein
MRSISALLLVTALASGAGCVRTDWIDRTLVTVDVTGTWYGSTSGAPKSEFMLELEQQGSTVKGSAKGTGGGSGGIGTRPVPIKGIVAGDMFRFRQTDGNLESELMISSDEMNGRVSLYGSYPISLRRVDSGSRPGSPPR